jgi:hypothetical protein
MRAVSILSVSISTEHTGRSTRLNAMGYETDAGACLPDAR